ncbi:ATP-binding protein [Leisingera daeponensis]|uniref:ATP-binding protein n=1 Tax=Leisingera daeponensis TaxID=405746 RepID=UPI0028F70B9D|nr:ATP-binding protein [Leisingera daeponensis]
MVEISCSVGLRPTASISERRLLGSRTAASDALLNVRKSFGSEPLTGALLDRLTHHVSILEMNGDSYRLAQSKARQNS